jgi:hypothetical protein
MYPRVAKAIKEDIGEEFFTEMQQHPDTFYKSLTKDQIRYLTRNGLKVKGTNANGSQGASDSVSSFTENNDDNMAAYSSQNLLQESSNKLNVVEEIDDITLKK